MACLFVAAKIEEDCRKIRDVVNVFHHLSQKRTGRYVLSVLFYTCGISTQPVIIMCGAHNMSTFYWLLEMPVIPSSRWKGHFNL